MYQLFYDGEEPPKVPSLPKRTNGPDWGSSGKDAPLLALFVQALSKTNESNRRMLLAVAQKKMARAAASSPAVRQRVA